MAKAVIAGGAGGTSGVTAAALIESAASRYAGHTAFIEAGMQTTLADHIASAHRMAATLKRDFNIVRSDRVAVIAQTSRQYIALWHAALLGHFIIVPLNARLTPFELAPILDNADPALLLYDGPLTGIALQLAGDFPDLPVIDMADIASAPPGDNRAEPPLPDDVAAIIYTTGTTGIPKGVGLTQSALACTAMRQHDYWDVTAAGARLYTTTPLFHVSAICAMLGPSLYGNLTVVTPSFDVDQLLEDSRTLKLTHLAVVAVMVDRLLDHPDFRPEEHRHLRYLVYGGSPIPWPTITKMRRLLPDTQLVQSYGMTEMLGASTALGNADHDTETDRLSSCGRALPGVEIFAAASDGRRLAIGEVGELMLRSDGITPGYWRNRPASDAAFLDGWFRSGDMGRIDADGYVQVVDRIKDMIITGGENVYSVEVERVIAELPGVAQVAVIGLPSAAWGETVHAVVVPCEGWSLDEQVLKRAIRHRLAGYKCPKSISFRRGPLPMVGNKISKLRIRDEMATQASEQDI